MMDEMRNDGARLAELIAKKNIGTPVFYSILSQFGYASRATQGKFIAAKTKLIPKNDLCLICSLFGFRPEDFDYPPNYFKSQFSHKESALFCFNHRNEGKIGHSSFIEKFFEEVHKYLLKVEEELLICDYLDKVRGIEHKENIVFYHEHNIEYYEVLEKHFAKKLKEEKPVKYKRLIQLPLGAPVSTFEEAVEFIIEEMFPESFAHLCRCLRDYKKHTEFYVIMKPFRLHTTYIVDGNVALTEYHRYDKKGIPVPDTLFVNIREPMDDEAVGSIYLKSCLDEFERMKNSERGNRLSIPSLIKCTFSLNTKIQNQIEALKDSIPESVQESYQHQIVEYAKKSMVSQSGKMQDRLAEQLKDWENHEQSLNILRKRRENIQEKVRIIANSFKNELAAGPSH